MEKKGNALYRHLRWLELCIGAALMVVLVFVAGRIVADIWQQRQSLTGMELFSAVLAAAFLLVIGVEFVKMTIKPTAENVLEVVMLTITRSLIIDHATISQSLLGVLALFLIFFIRRFLFFDTQTAESASDEVVVTETAPKEVMPTAFGFHLSVIDYRSKAKRGKE